MQPTPVYLRSSMAGSASGTPSSMSFIHQRDFYAMAGSELGHPPPKILSMRKAYVFATLAEIINRIKGVKDAKFCRTSMFLSEAFGQ